MKSVAGTLRLSLAQFRELEAFVQFAQDLDPETAKRIDNGRRMVEVLKQGRGAPMPFEEQVAVLYAATNGYFDTVPIPRLREAEKKLLEYLDAQHKKIMDSIRKDKAVSDGAKDLLNKALELFIETHADLTK
jgi:F-type H+-transporting ATPase subunit alpha